MWLGVKRTARRFVSAKVQMRFARQLRWRGWAVLGHRFDSGTPRSGRGVQGADVDREMCCLVFNCEDGGDFASHCGGFIPLVKNNRNKSEDGVKIPPAMLQCSNAQQACHLQHGLGYSIGDSNRKVLVCLCVCFWNGLRIYRRLSN